MSHFMDKQIVDEWTKTRDGVSARFRARYIGLTNSIEIEFLSGSDWINYDMDGADAIIGLITRLYEENQQLKDDTEYSHHDAESI